jgi:hypothetical protein
MELSKSGKAVAYDIDGMRRGDIYIDEDGAILIRDSEEKERLHHIGPFGDHWMITGGVAWPVQRIYKQDRGDCEDPREFKKTLKLLRKNDK